jgi:hypothetical protein
MKNVYVVSYTYYDWSEVRAVFETEEAAQAYIDERVRERPVERRRLHADPAPMFYSV